MTKEFHADVSLKSADLTMDDGGSFITYIQAITATANRTVSFPDANGTVALVPGADTQVAYNSSGALAADANLTYDGTTLTAVQLAVSGNSALSDPTLDLTGTWITGGTATTTKPHVLIEPTGATSTAWDTNGTGIGINAASGFAGTLIEAQVDGTQQFGVDASGNVLIPAGDLTFTEKADHTSTPAAGGGYLWVKSDTPNALIFTDDAGTDHNLNNPPPYKYSTTFGNASDTSFSITHNLGTKLVTVSVYETSSGDFVEAALSHTDDNTLVVDTSPTVPAAGFYTIVIIY